MPKELQTKLIFDNVEKQIKKKPETTISGWNKKTGKSADIPKLNSQTYSTTLVETPIFRNNKGVSMSNEFQDEGFLKLPRSLLNSESWRSLTFRHKGLFLYLLEKVQYKTKVYTHRGKDIFIYPGQYCVTYRRLVEEYNQNLKFKKEHIDVPFLQRSVSLYDKFLWTDTRSDTGIMIITITYKELYEHFKSLGDTCFDTKTIQKRYTNEERKKERKIKETIERACALDSSLSNLEKKKRHPDFIPEIPTQKLTEEKKKHIQLLWQFIVQNNMSDTLARNGIKEKDLEVWIAKHDGKEIMECLKLALKAQPKKTWPGYVTKLLKDKIPKKEEDSKNGKKFVEDFIKKNRLNHIDMKKDYFLDLISNDQSYYHLPVPALEGILKNSLERYLEREKEEKIEKEYEVNY